MNTPQDIIRWSFERFAPRLALSTSFQKGGLVILDMARHLELSLRVVTLDTGRLPEETYAMVESIRSRYGVAVEMISPDAGEVEAMVDAHGPNLFYRDRPSRLLCCRVRKVRPLAARTAGLSAVLTGLRRDQSANRHDIEQVEAGEALVKVNPLAYWSAEEVDQYTELHKIPVHPLYAKGYTSIGCAPCTRAHAEGEDARGGRWWWETEDGKECGIHFTPDGRMQRTVDVMLEEITRHG